METVQIYRLTGLRPRCQARLRAAQMEAAQVWTLCRDLHLAARQQRTSWPTKDDFHQASKGRLALHSQTVQAIFRAFVGNVGTTRELRKTNPNIRYPYKDKRFYPLLWPAQAVSWERGRIVLPMGRGRPSLIFVIDLPEQSGACKLVWKDGYELHVAVAADACRMTTRLCPGHGGPGGNPPGGSDTPPEPPWWCPAEASGRSSGGTKALGQIARKRHRCQNGSRRDRRLQAARRTASARKRRQIRDLRHKGTRGGDRLLPEEGSWLVLIGNPHGVRNRSSGRHHNQRLSQWEYGRDIAYLIYKATLAHIESFTGPERGTSSRCPVCGWNQKVRGRVWRCHRPGCTFMGHRDVVGSVNMHPLAFGHTIDVPAHVTYQRPGPLRVRPRDEQPGRCGTAAGTL